MRRYVVKGRVLDRKDDRDDVKVNSTNSGSWVWTIIKYVFLYVGAFFLMVFLSVGFKAVADSIDISYTPLGEDVAKEFNYEGEPKGLGEYLYDFVKNSDDATDVMVVKAKEFVGKPVFQRTMTVTDVEFFDKQGDLLNNIGLFNVLSFISNFLLTTSAYYIGALVFLGILYIMALINN